MNHDNQTTADILYALDDAISEIAAHHGLVVDLGDEDADSIINSAVHAAYDVMVAR